MPTRENRRTQEERSASTKRHILETTFNCLNELGYAGTTTVEVCKHGQISRGAMLHHYPTKDHLVVAAVQYVFDKRFDEFRDVFASLPADGDRRSKAVDLLWQIFSGPTFYVWLELLVAARTNRHLNEAVSTMAQAFSDRLTATSAEVLPDEDSASAQLSYKFAFAVMTGLSVDRIIPDAVPAENILNILKVIAQE